MRNYTKEDIRNFVEVRKCEFCSTSVHRYFRNDQKRGNSHQPARKGT